MLETDNNGITTNSEIPAKQISDDGIKNFLSAACDIVVYDLNYDKNFKAIQLVLEKLKKDKVFSKAIENNAASLYRKMVNEVNYINKKIQIQVLSSIIWIELRLMSLMQANFVYWSHFFCPQNSARHCKTN